MANQGVPADAAATRQWLEIFVASEYTTRNRNLYCIPCMEGALDATGFKPHGPHAGHPHLQVRKHDTRNYVVNVADLAKFIDAGSVQTYGSNSKAPTYALRTRKRAWRRLKRACAWCQDSIGDTSSREVTLCSIECLLRASPGFPLTVVKSSARDPPNHPTNRWPGTQEEESAARDQELESLQVVQLEAVSSAMAEKMWSRATKSAWDATFERNANFKWDNVVSVWRAGSYARFLSSVLSRDERDRLEQRDRGD